MRCRCRLNAFDANFHSFEKLVLPELNKRGIAALGMKPMTGKADPLKKGLLTPDEALRYAMSLPRRHDDYRHGEAGGAAQNLQIAQNFKPMTAAEMEALRQRCKNMAADGAFRALQGFAPVR